MYRKFTNIKDAVRPEREEVRPCTVKTWDAYNVGKLLNWTLRIWKEGVRPYWECVLIVRKPRAFEEFLFSLWIFFCLQTKDLGSFPYYRAHTNSIVIRSPDPLFINKPLFTNIELIFVRTLWASVLLEDLRYSLEFHFYHTIAFTLLVHLCKGHFHVHLRQINMHWEQKRIFWMKYMESLQDSKIAENKK